MEISKFNFAEIFSNSKNGKTSAGKVVGVFLCFSGIIFFGYGVFFVKQLDLLNVILLQSLAIIGLGSGLILGKIIKPTE